MPKIKRWSLLIIVAAVGVLAYVPATLNAAPLANSWYVMPTGSDSYDCQSTSTPCATIQGAIDKAAAGDSVLVTTDVYTGSSTTVINVTKSITLTGGWNASFTTQDDISIIDGQNTRRGIMVIGSGVVVVIDRFIVQNGRADGSAGVYNYSANLTMSRCTVKKNQSTQVDGGGIYNWQGILTINGCAIIQNAAAASGGGITNYGTLYLNNSTVADNIAAVAGGGIYSNGNATVNSSTISNNHSGTQGGGGISSYAFPFTVQNTIVSHNTTSQSGPDCKGDVSSLGYNLIGSTSGCAYTSTAGDLLNIDPGFVSLVNWLTFYALPSTSPAVNAGNPAGCTDHSGAALTIDQRGVARNGRCDIGAFEYTGAGSAASIYAISGTPQTALVSTTFPNTMRAVVADNVGNLITGTTVVFLAPVAGAGGTFSDSETFSTTAPTDSGGIASAAQFAANAVAGYYTVTAAVEGVQMTANFKLNNIARAFLPLCVRNFCADLFDDFSNPSTGWPISEDNYVRSEYLAGEYRVFSKQGGYLYLFRSPSCGRENYTVKADARWVGTPGDSYGIVFGISGSSTQYYLFYVSADFGEYGLFRRDTTGFVSLQPFTASPAIQSGGAVNHLEVTRNGSQITLIANGALLGTWFDSTIGGTTWAGIYSSPYDNQSNSDARFDNFSMATLLGSRVSAMGVHPSPAMISVPGLIQQGTGITHQRQLTPETPRRLPGVKSRLSIRRRYFSLELN